MNGDITGAPSAGLSNIDRAAPIAPRRVAVIVLNWNGRDETLACVESLQNQTYGQIEIIVVDNGSQDDSVLAIGLRFPHIAILSTGQNLGYAGGNNAGLRHVIEAGEFEHVLVLNNDTIAPPDFVESLVRSSLEAPSRTILSPLVVDNGNPPHIWYNGARWDPSKLLFVLDQRPRPADAPLLEETQIAIGCALFAPVSAFVEIGLFDERLFLMHEEADWCFRATKRGYRFFVTRRTALTHLVSVSFGGSDSLLSRYFDIRNRLYFAERHLSLTQWGSTVRSCMSGLASVLMDTVPWTPPSGFRGSAKQWYWALQRYKRDPDDRKATADSRRRDAKVQLAAIGDYVRRRTGDCPAWLRAKPMK